MFIKTGYLYKRIFDDGTYVIRKLIRIDHPYALLQLVKHNRPFDISHTMARPINIFKDGYNNVTTPEFLNNF